MAETTIERIRATASHLAAVPDGTLALLMEDAALEVSKLKAPEEYKEKLVRYLTIHFASVEKKTVLKEKLEGLEKVYADNDGAKGLASTVYGAEYQRMLDDLGLSPKKVGLNLMVL
ncbi:DUF4054 domain-containing protein [Domibacillus iocasae]|uniref:DUF4054 domain-containing protein n=1 Tax=Domibacillus iocasae TaxID=1714016 RepID=A0A1E7DQA3_9BACI|nr:DUF4054 domain-containing protein [Domibacillus iocasae]OES45234.1 hypothetical protein BA724_04290 [Domibacillus iocasae]